MLQPVPQLGGWLQLSCCCSNVAGGRCGRPYRQSLHCEQLLCSIDGHGGGVPASHESVLVCSCTLASAQPVMAGSVALLHYLVDNAGAICLAPPAQVYMYLGVGVPPRVCW